MYILSGMLKYRPTSPHGCNWLIDIGMYIDSEGSTSEHQGRRIVKEVKWQWRASLYDILLLYSGTKYGVLCIEIN